MHLRAGVNAVLLQLSPAHPDADGRCRVSLHVDPRLAAVGDGPQAATCRAVVAIADGILTELDRLAQRLDAAGVAVPDRRDGAALWLATAFAALGPSAFDVLEGEFVAAIWDDADRTWWAVSDPSGRVPLYWTRTSDGLICGDQARAVARAAGHEALDPLVLAERCALLGGRIERTGWQNVARVGGGQILRWRSTDAAPQVVHTRPYAPFNGGDQRPADEAAAALAAALGAATIERLAPAGLTTVWMSGGYDSTAVFASAHGLGLPAGQRLLPVSISYPVGSAGREDEWIEAAASRWSAPVQWLTLDSAAALRAAFLPMLDDMDDAFAHVYGYASQALARRSAAAGAAVAFDGYGGDGVFHAAPDAFLRDLTRRGRVAEAWREFRAFSLGGRRAFVQRAILPVLPPVVARLLGRLAQVPVPGPMMARALPPWLGTAAAPREPLADAARELVPRARGESYDAWVTRALLEAPFFQRVQQAVRRIARQEGVAYRSPIMDRRVVELMAMRPRADRASTGESKRLLREAMRGLLPAELLAPRAARTGVPAAELTGASVALIDGFLASGGPEALAGLGVLHMDAYRSAAEAFVRQPERWAHLGLELVATLSIDHWARMRQVAAPVR